jgi:hypothetical protein
MSQHDIMSTMVRTHGKTGSPVYHAWLAMIARCTNPNNPSYKNYGARGITIDPRWLTFENFYEDMGDPPQGTSIDRIENDEGYFSGNCQWSTRSQQNANRRGYGHSSFKGVYWHPQRKKWSARVNDKHIGLFVTEEEAAQAVAEYKENSCLVPSNLS